jgi:guanine deaminase
MNKKEFMCAVIKEAAKNLTELTGGPFGACIVREGKVIAIARNAVLKNDATCHAEMNAIREASKKLKTFDLSGCVIYSTTEPCPMCFSAIHWAKIDHIIYGTNIADAARAGFNELKISNATLKRLGKAKIKIEAGFMARECAALFTAWQDLAVKYSY